MQLVGSPFETDASGRALYRAARVGDLELTLGAIVSLRNAPGSGDGDGSDASDDETDASAMEVDGEASGSSGKGAKGKGGDDVTAGRPLGLVTALFKDEDGDMRLQVCGECGSVGSVRLAHARIEPASLMLGSLGRANLRFFALGRIWKGGSPLPPTPRPPSHSCG